MTIPTCQTPSKEADRVGESGEDPPKFGESVFVADEAPEVLDVPHHVNANNPVVTVCVETTRCLGTVDNDGFLLFAEQQVAGDFLANPLRLTVRAAIGAPDVGGVLGRDGLDVEVILHRGTSRPLSLGKLEGGFLGHWENYALDVPITSLVFPFDPCPELAPADLCPEPLRARANEISFVFSGPALPPGDTRELSMIVDWVALAPKEGKHLAVQPVLFVHGWFGLPKTWDDSVWTDAMDEEDLPFHVIGLPGDGLIQENAALIAGFAQNLKDRFGVERINIVAHSKGGVDSREYIRNDPDVDLLIMITTPNEGTGLAKYLAVNPRGRGVKQMTQEAMRAYNQTIFPNMRTAYVTASGDCDSALARKVLSWLGPNDEVVPVASVQALFYTTKFEYASSRSDVESVGICASKSRFMTNHSCLLYKRAILDDVLPAFVPLHAPRPAPTPVLELVAGGARAADVAVEPEATVQLLTTSTGTVAAGATQQHAVLVDPVDSVSFLVAADPNVLDLALVSPGGVRIDATTTDPNVTRVAADEVGPMSYLGFDVTAPEPGTWTVEVIGLEVPVTYGLASIAQLAPGAGLTLEARVEPDRLPAGEQVTVVATLTQDGLPVTDAVVTAAMVHPDGATRTEFTLADDGTGADALSGDGVYTAVFTDTVEPGSYEVQISASRPDPAATRAELLPVLVTRSGSTFSGTSTDRGVDLDGDGLFDQLVIDLGLVVDIAATYRIFATLARTELEEPIDQVRLELALNPGEQSVPVTFPGSLLFDRQLDGPYLVTGLVLEDLDSAEVIAVGEPYTTGPYQHTQFQRPGALLTGVTSDHGVNTPDRPLVPFEELQIDVEVDLVAAAHVEAVARLRGSDGSLIDVADFSADLPAGPSMLGFTFSAFGIFEAGLPGPYTLQELTLTGDGFSLDVPEAVAVTQPYALEDFGPSPSFTVGGTVIGLVGTGLILELVGGTFPTPLRRNADGPFTFLFPELFGGNSYEVQVETQPGNPVQVCTVSNGTGVIAAGDVTDVVVTCLPPA